PLRAVLSRPAQALASSWPAGPEPAPPRRRPRRKAASRSLSADVGPAQATRPDDHDRLDDYIEARAVSAERQAQREATDPKEIRAREQERRLLRLLIAIVVVIVVGGFAISIIGLLLVGVGGGH